MGDALVCASCFACMHMAGGVGGLAAGHVAAWVWCGHCVLWLSWKGLREVLEWVPLGERNDVRKGRRVWSVVGSECFGLGRRAYVLVNSEDGLHDMLVAFSWLWAWRSSLPRYF